MRSAFTNFVSIYSFAPTNSQKQADLGGKATKYNPAWVAFTKIQDEISSLPFVSEYGFDVDSSCGNSGNWLKIPYVRVFDKNTAPSPSAGVYVVYLFSEDGKRLYLTLSIGGSGYEKKNMTPQEMAETALNISNGITDKQGFEGTIERGSLGSDAKAKNYEIGVALHKEYDLSNLPSDEEMIDDLRKLCGIYSAYLNAESAANQEQQPIVPIIEQDPPELVYPKNLVFYGAPGTGKTYRTVNQAVAICLKKPLSEINAMPRDELTAKYRELVSSGKIDFVTFHQSYSYEDFVIGIFPELATGKDKESQGIRYIRKNGVFKALCDKARGEKDTNFVLIIDEINRGNISKIFGELITLIEESKREGQPEETRVLLPYMDNKEIDRFVVPENVYIIGTMNTADRSIQHVDTALRRRFVFEEVLPDSSLFKDINITAGEKTLNIAVLLDSINRRIKRYFDREHVIGHAYLMPLKREGLSDAEKLHVLGDIFHEEIIPLLQDYFFEDYSKIQKVLGEKPETDNSISLIWSSPDNAREEEDEGRDVYEVAPNGHAAYTNIDTYLLMTK